MKHILSAAVLSLALLSGSEVSAQDHGRRGQGWSNVESRGRDDGYYRGHHNREHAPRGRAYGYYKNKDKKHKDKWKDKEWKDRRDRDDDDRWDDRDRRRVIYRDRDGRPVYDASDRGTSTGKRRGPIPQRYPPQPVPQRPGGSILDILNGR